MEQLPIRKQEADDGHEQMARTQFAVQRSVYMSDGGVTIKTTQEIVAFFDNEQDATKLALELEEKFGYENHMTGWSDGPPDSISFGVIKLISKELSYDA